LDDGLIDEIELLLTEGAKVFLLLLTTVGNTVDFNVGNTDGLLVGAIVDAAVGDEGVLTVSFTNTKSQNKPTV
jgi:hypothetical protein